MYTTEVRLKDQGSLPIDGPTEIILHSLANGWHFEGGVEWLEDPNNPLEAHYAIRFDGYRVQVVSYYMRADANYNANRRAISVETDSDVDAIEEWTPDQCASIIELCVDLIRKFPTITAILCPGPYDSGIGYHVMWGAPGEWTPVNKTCPGPARIAQVTAVIIPGVQAALAGTPTDPTTPPSEEEEITVAQFEELKTLISDGFAAINSNVDGEGKNGVAVTRSTALTIQKRIINDQRNSYRVMLRTLASIQTLVNRNADASEINKIVDDAVKEITAAMPDDNDAPDHAVR